MTIASDKQQEYIVSLIQSKYNALLREAAGIRATCGDLDAQVNRHAKAAVQRADLLASVYRVMLVPNLISVKQASGWITALKNAGHGLIEAALDTPAVAERMGLTDLIGAQGAAIEQALS